MNDELEFLKTIARRLDEAGIAYMLTGSMAMALYAAPRMTRDIDVVVEIGQDRGQVLCGLFSPDCHIDPIAVQRALETQGMFNIIHETWIIKADFIIRKADPYRLEEFRRRRQVAIDGVGISVVAPEDLILSKLVWAKDSRSETQFRDIRQIIGDAVGLDWDYLGKWAADLGVGDLLAEVKP